MRLRKMKMSNNKKGFTLIELLVVIAIIAILAGILFPVFARARNNSYTATCASNLGQFHKAFTMYAADKGGRFPVSHGTGNPGITWMHGGSTGAGLDKGALMPYIRMQMKPDDTANNLWTCPMAMRMREDVVDVFYSPGSNYMMNDYLRALHGGQTTGNYTGGDVNMWLTGINPDAVKHPSRVILLFEGLQNDYGHVDRGGSIFYINSSNGNAARIYRKNFKHLSASNPPKAGIAQNYHNGRSNFLFLDGHVKSLIPSETWSQKTYDDHKTRTHFREWVKAYPNPPHGQYDMWNPYASNVTFP